MTTPHWTFTDGSTMPIGTMYCIGRNYAAHAREMGAAVPAEPLVFLKPPSAYVADGGRVVLPSWTRNVHHEVEVVAVIGDAAAAASAVPLDAVAGYGIGLDLTARDIQAVAKERGEPWARSKAWRGSAPVSAIVPRHTCGDGPFGLHLLVNGERRQHGSTTHMERTVGELVAWVDTIFGLRPGDAVFTGTPDGVAALHAGDHVQAYLDTIVTLTVDIL